MNERDVRLKSIVAGREALAAGHDLPRHRHREAYAIVGLRGAFDQVGYAGRVRLTAGHLLVQPALDCHANRMVTAGAEILRLPWPYDTAPGPGGLGGLYALDDVDAIVRTAERDVVAAAALARAGCAPRARIAGRDDLPDELAIALAADAVGSLRAWAEQRGLARETVSRAFTAAYGVDARRFRAELRARAAWLQITTTTSGLAAIAAATAFADQAHMTRSVRAHTGRSPAAWRAESQ